MHDSVPDAPFARPTSHRWALFVFAAFCAAAVYVMSVVRLDLAGVAVLLVCLAALVASLGFTRSHQTYYIGVTALALVMLRSVQSLWFYLAAFHAERLVSFVPVVFGAAGFVLLAALLRAYALGSRSRQYIGLAVRTTKPGA